MLAAALLAVASACGARSAQTGCEGLVARGACWVASGGVTLSRQRVEQVVDLAAELWEREVPALTGWRVELGPQWVVVDGERFAGYTWPDSRSIAVAVGSPDCFERSALLHELGHAWGHDDDDPRMSSGWEWIREAMRRSGWPGCDVDLDPDAVPVRTRP